MKLLTKNLLYYRYIEEGGNVTTDKCNQLKN